MVSIRIYYISQKYVAQWALKGSNEYLHYFDSHLRNAPRIKLGVKSLKDRMNGKIRAYDLCKVGFIVNELAKDSTSEASKYTARAFATGHMRGHVLVRSDYLIKLINTLTHNPLETATEERERQLRIIADVFNHD